MSVAKQIWKTVQENPLAVKNALLSFTTAVVSSYFTLIGHASDAEPVIRHMTELAGQAMMVYSIVSAMIATIHWSRGPAPTNPKL